MQGLPLEAVLDLPVLRRAGVRVVACADRLERGVRWLHASELPDVAQLLRDGDLVLTTGSDLPSDNDAAGFCQYAESLRDAGAAGVIIELGRRWTPDLPGHLIEAFEEVELPLISLAHEVRFAAVTQAVGELIVDRQLRELRDAQRVHEVFTELSFAQAGPEEVLEAVQRLAGAAVVVESEQNQVLDYLAGPADASDFLADWSVRSARVALDGRTGWDRTNRWLVTRLGPKERRWGRLVIQSPQPPTQRLIAVAERAAAALALHRLHHRDRDNLVRRTHYELINGLCKDCVPADVTRRCELAGFPITSRRFVGLTIRPLATQGASRRARAVIDEVIATAVRASSELRAPALLCEVDGDAQILLSLPERIRSRQLVDELGRLISRHHRVFIGAGRDAVTVSTVERSLAESRQVVDALGASAEPSLVHRLEDVHVRGLLTLLAGDERLQLFVERELEMLEQHDSTSTVNLTDAVRALLWNPASKTEAAASLHLSRAAFYSRLERVQQILGLDLDDPEIRLSLHLALLARDLAPAAS